MGKMEDNVKRVVNCIRKKLDNSSGLINKELLEDLVDVFDFSFENFSFEDFLKIVYDENISFLFDEIIKNDFFKKIFQKNSFLKNLVDVYCFNYDDRDVCLSEINSDLRLYINEIPSRVSLTREQEKAYFDLIRAGDRDAYEFFLKNNLNLVVMVAMRYHTKRLSFLDIIQEGNMGLMKAMENFDQNKGYMFSTYAVNWIKQYINRALVEKESFIRLPDYMFTDINKMEKKREKLKKMLGRNPTDLELSQEMGVSLKKMLYLKTCVKKVVSIDKIIDDELESALIDIISDSSLESVDDEVIRDINADNLRRVLKTLTEREEKVLILRYGLDDDCPRDFGEIAPLFGVTRQAVSRNEKVALEKLRDPLRRELLITDDFNHPLWQEFKKDVMIRGKRR